MPNIDVTELFSDPDFATSFLVTRTPTLVGDNGRETGVPQAPVAATGSVQPAQPLSLQRLPEGSNLSGAVEVYTTFRLTNGDATLGLQADVITWRGTPYTVMDVKDWTEFGAGFIQATCVIGVLNK